MARAASVVPRALRMISPPHPEVARFGPEKGAAPVSSFGQSAKSLRPKQGSEFLDGAEVGLGRFVFRIPRVLPVEAERGGRLPAEPLVVLALGLEDLCVVPVLAEDDDPGFEFLQLGDRLLSESGEAVLDPGETLPETLIHAVGLPPADGDEEDDDLRAKEVPADHVELVV